MYTFFNFLANVLYFINLNLRQNSFSLKRYSSWEKKFNYGLRRSHVSLLGSICECVKNSILAFEQATSASWGSFVNVSLECVFTKIHMCFFNKMCPFLGLICECVFFKINMCLFKKKMCLLGPFVWM